MKNTVVNNIKAKFVNSDGSLNKTTIASFITLLIVLIQQIMIACGFSYGHWDKVYAIINTILNILGLCGFVEGNGEVEIPTTNVKSTPDNSGQNRVERVQKGSDTSNESQKK